MNIIDKPSPNWSPRGGAVPAWIILHGTAGFTTAQQCAAFFSAASSQVSAHYIIGMDGTVVRCVDEGVAAWACGGISGPAGVGGDAIHHDAWWDDAPLWGDAPNPNPVTISIEHIKPSTDNSDILTVAQTAASFLLISGICSKWGIPRRQADASGGITGHFSMDPVNRSRCPGPYPWEKLWSYLKQGDNAITPSKWQSDDAAKEWQSTALLFTGGVAPSFTSGIAKAWQSRVYLGQRIGPPLTAEYGSTDWSGNAIKVQEFTNARCEWRVDGSSCRFFDGRGEIV